MESKESATTTSKKTISCDIGKNIDYCESSSSSSSTTVSSKKELENLFAPSSNESNFNTENLIKCGFHFSNSYSNEVGIAPHRLTASDINFSRILNKTFVSGRDIHAPLNEFGTGNSHVVIKPASLLGITNLNSLQRATWPHIVRGRSCTIIGGNSNKRGKTFSYIAPIFSNLLTPNMQELLKKESKEHFGPVGLIICGSSTSGEKIESIITKFTVGTRMTHVYLNEYETRAKFRLRSNPEFVITSLKCASHLFENFIDLFRFERLRYLIIDDIQITMREEEEVESLVLKIFNFRQQLNAPLNLQTILCGSLWNNKILAASLKFAPDMVLHFGAPFLAMQFAGIDIRVKMLANRSNVTQIIADLFSPDAKVKLPNKIVIFCNTREVAQVLKKDLYEKYNIFTHCIGEDGSGDNNYVSNFRSVINSWNSCSENERFVLLIDHKSVLEKEFTITDATCVINYDIPNEKQEGLGVRHNCMRSHYPDISLYATDGKRALLSKVPLTSYMFLALDEPENYQILLKLHSIGVEFSPQLIKLANKKITEAVIKKPLCGDFISFGKCLKQTVCKFRHYFKLKELEANSNVPKNTPTGRVQVEILSASSVCNFKAKLISFYEVKNDKPINRISYKNLANTLQKDLDAYYADEKNRIPYRGDVRKGILCAFLDSSSEIPHYRRGRVIMLLESDDEIETKVRVFQVDIGRVVVRETSKLFILPPELKGRKEICIDLVLANLKPPGEETSFSIGSRKIANSLNERILTGQVVLSVENTVWVCPLIEHSKSPDGSWRQVTNARLYFLKQSPLIAEHNSQHMELLYKSAEEAYGKSVYDLYRQSALLGADFENDFYEKDEPFRWAFLPSNEQMNRNRNEPPWTKVWCTSFKKLSLIFVQRDDRTKALDSLTIELDRDVLKCIESKYAKYETIFKNYYQVGFPVAAYDSDNNTWTRALIFDIISKESSNETYYSLFYVDDGSIAHEVESKYIFPLKKSYVSSLPFQVIALSTPNVVPVGTPSHEIEGFIWDTCDEVSDVIGPYFISDEGQSLSLDIGVIREEESFLKNGVVLCKVYDAFIIPSSHPDSKELSEIVVENSLGIFPPGAQEEVKRFKDSLLEFCTARVDAQLAKDLENDEESSDDENEMELVGPQKSNNETSSLVNDLKDDDEEPDEVDKESARAFLKLFGIDEREVASKFQEINEKNSLYNSKTVAINKGDESNKVVEADNGEKNDVEGTVEEKNPKKKEISRMRRTKIIAGTECGLKKPTVEWSQDARYIKLYINITDLNHYSISYAKSSSILSFESLNPPDYGFKLKLFAKIREPVESLPGGQYLSLKCKKQTMGIKWSRLEREKIRRHWLKNKINEKCNGDISSGDDEAQNGLDNDDENTFSEVKFYDSEPDEEEEEKEKSSDERSDIEISDAEGSVSDENEKEKN